MTDQMARLVAVAEVSGHGWHSSKGNSRGGPLIGSNNEQNCPIVENHDRAWRKWASLAMVLARPRLPSSEEPYNIGFFFLVHKGCMVPLLSQVTNQDSPDEDTRRCFGVPEWSRHPLEWRLVWRRAEPQSRLPLFQQARDLTDHGTSQAPLRVASLQVISCNDGLVVWYGGVISNQ